MASISQTNATGYELPTYEFTVPPELSNQGQQKYPVVIAGAGLAGLTAACDLALKGIPVVIIDDDNTIGVRGASSRGICYAQKTLEIFKRFGIYERIVQKGIQWSVGKTLAGDEVVYSFDLKKQPTHSSSTLPPFINLQQFYIEWFLVDRLLTLSNVEIRWKSKILKVEQNNDSATLTIETPAGSYQLSTEWLIDATGVRSPIRDGFGLKTNPAAGEDRWCISDVRFKHKPPIERWTWVEAPFNENRAVWQHLMADDVWRLDYQMAPDSDPDFISRPEVVAQRLAAQFGPDIDFELVWVGPYGYRSHILEQFVHGRVLFIGDSAHVMSPFGARGGNSAIQDADNLGWKLAMVLKGQAGRQLLESYHRERYFAAAQNVQITSRTMRFLTPVSPAQKVFRQAVIDLARRYEFARTLVNTGRLSSPTEYGEHSLGSAFSADVNSFEPLQVSAVGRSLGNCSLTTKQSGQTDLVTLMSGLENKLVFVACDPDTAQQVQLALAQAKQNRTFVWSWQVIQLVTNLDPTSTLDDIETWADSSPYLQTRFELESGKVAWLRPDLHTGGTLQMNMVVDYMHCCLDAQHCAEPLSLAGSKT